MHLSYIYALQGMLHAAALYRQTKADVYQSGVELNPLPEYIPWTSSSGNSGLRTLIHKQVLSNYLPEYDMDIIIMRESLIHKQVRSNSSTRVYTVDIILEIWAEDLLTGQI